MGSVHDGDTKVILRRLAVLLVCFYALYYALATMYMFALRVPYRASLPFDHVEFGIKNRRSLGMYAALSELERMSRAGARADRLAC